MKKILLAVLSALAVSQVFAASTETPALETARSPITISVDENTLPDMDRIQILVLFDAARTAAITNPSPENTRAATIFSHELSTRTESQAEDEPEPDQGAE